eukprot:Phypoly_transcript_07205.p1 GENE.Phypoly_transcript_07205~~Phypoly_transcript_07205.p1  ORF type:complete len:518 (+),score=86.69 Phypoly_transcript_07205:96-1649(+)
MDGTFPGVGLGGGPQIFNLQQIGGALGIFAVLDKYFGGNPYLSAGFGILIVTTFYQYFQRLVKWLWTKFKKQTYFSISCDQNDESYRWLMEWFAEQPYSRLAREMSIRASWGMVTPSGQPVPPALLSLNRRRIPGEEDSDDDEEDENGLKQKRPRVMWIPAEGTHYFRYKGVLVSLTRGGRAVAMAQAGGPGAAPSVGGENLVVTAYTTNRKFLRDVVRDARRSYYSRQENKTTIYVGEEAHWKTVGMRNKRDLSSVVLDDHVLKGLSDDLRTFINDKEWYIRCGVPYRRGYLLYGPPGTGKTSFILSIAGKFELSVCVLVLSSSAMNDQKLGNLIKNSPANSILLLEDVDVAFVTGDPSANKITFSGLLNAIDGVAAGDGRILFMTTNHIERLAPALIRPGRVDVRVHFDLASKAQIRGMFWRFYKDLKFPNLDAIAEQVEARIEERTVSTAQLQGLFIRYKVQPQELLDNLDEFIETCKKEWTTEETRSSLLQKAHENPVEASAAFPVIQKQIRS